jgi:transposase, IS5 family
MQLFIANAKAGLVGDRLLTVADVIQWGEVEKHMQADYWQAMFRKGGRAPYDYRAMLRALLIARWFGLSYPKLERALRVRLDFMLFCGFVIGNKMPDASTLHRFKSRFDEGGALSAMFEEVERQLFALGIQVRLVNGALVEAGIEITSCKILA